MKLPFGPPARMFGELQTVFVNGKLLKDLTVEGLTAAIQGSLGDTHGSDAFSP